MSSPKQPEIYEAILNRRSLRPGEYKPDTVDRTVIERLVQAANAAPTHKRSYPWRFIVFDTASAKTSLGNYMADVEAAKAEQPVPEIKLNKTRERPTLAAAVIAIVMRPDLERLPEWEEIAATSAAVQNLWLALSAEGLAGYWSSPAALCAGAEDFLGLSAGERCLGAFYLGYPALEPAAIQRPDPATKLSYFGE